MSGFLFYKNTIERRFGVRSKPSVFVFPLVLVRPLWYNEVPTLRRQAYLVYLLRKAMVYKTNSSYRFIRSEAAVQRCFLGKGALKICSKFTGEYPFRSAISIKLQNNFVEISLRHGCSPVNLLHIFRVTSPRNTSGWLLTSGKHSINSKLRISSSVMENYIYEAILYNLVNPCEVFL